MGTYRMFMCFARKLRITEQAPPADVKAIFQEFTEGGTRMTAEQLHRFLVEFQGDGWASMAKAEEIVEQVLQRRHHIARFTRHTLSLDDFFHYLFSEDLNPLLGDKVHQDMTAPLSHYFIYTGHNSYLTGNQLSSECSDVPIIKALKRGLRVVELDLWPNSTKDNVLVLHGWTLTSPVDLMKCLKSIKEYAFLASPYPVILTLEDHLTPHLQAKVAQMINQSFGDMVFYPESQGLEEFPSPEELKYRIIISTKLPKEHRQAKSYKNRRIHSQKERNSDEDVSVKEPSDPAAVQEDDKKSDCLTSKQNEYDENINNAEDQESRVLGVLAYKRLISIPSRSAKTSLKEALNVESNKVRRLSFGELKFEKATALYGTDVLRFTQKNLLRIYPKGTRVTSSNYKPLTGWMHGAQMVAFNMQGYGRSLWLMHGMFRANGGCGYVKKPDFLMNACPDDRFLDPKAKFPVKKNLKVKVCIGYGWHLNSKKTQFNLWSSPDFYTRVGIAGVPADKTMKRTKTQRDSWTPVWDEEFIFPLTVPELALLRVEVHDYNMSEKDDFAGQTCLPVSELKPGIRAVPLFDRKGEQLVSVRLLMRFEFI